MNRRNKGASCIKLIYYALLLFILFGYIVYPMMNTLKLAFIADGKFTTSVVSGFLANENNIQSIINTFYVGVGSVICCGILGTLLALAMHFTEMRGKRLLHILILTPMMLSGVIIVMAFVQLYGESGIVTGIIKAAFHLEEAPYSYSGLPGILFTIMYTQYVYFYLNISVALDHLDYSAVEAARSLGAGKARILTDVVFPTVLPAFISSCAITFVSAIGAYAAPNLIGGGFKVLSTQIVRSKANNYMDIASVQVLCMLFMAVTTMLLLQYYKKKFSFAQNLRATGRPHGEKRFTAGNVIGRIFIAVQIVMILLPIAGIIYLSFNTTHSIMTDIFPRDITLENYSDIIKNRRVMQPVANSLKMSLFAVFAGLVLVVPVSYLNSRNDAKKVDSEGGGIVRRPDTMRIARLFMLLPWCMPVSVIAINMINAFNVPSVFAFGNSLVGGYYILPIAYTVVALPLLLNYSEVSMNSFNFSLEEASRSLGASQAETVFRVVIPYVMPGIVAGGMLIFVRTIGEYTMSALLYGVYNRPISISMVTNMQEFHIGISMAYGVVVILINYVSLLIFSKLRKEK